MFRSYKDTFRTPVRSSKDTPKKYSCDLCDKEKIPTGWDLELDAEIHRRRVHKDELIHLMRESTNFMCCICLRQQADHAALIAHIKTHHLLTPADGTVVKREIFICDYCNNLFFNKLLLIAHINYFHLLTLSQKRNIRTPCPSCYKHVKVRSIWFHFLYHDIIHTGTCPICLTTFKDYNEALKHAECHPGFYSCTICPYEAKKENLFLNHLEKHRKPVNIEGKYVSAIAKYFVPQWKVPLWSRKFMNIFKGVTLAPQLLICVLCRAICETEEQMKQHIYGDHTPENIVEIKRHLCVCGEEFFNNVLLKHHIFTLKGDHKVDDAPRPPMAKRRKTDASDVPDYSINNAENWIEVQIEENLSPDNDHDIGVDQNSSDSSQFATLYVPINNESDEEDTPLSKDADSNEEPTSNASQDKEESVSQSNDTPKEILNQNQPLLYVTIDENESGNNTKMESNETDQTTNAVNTDEQTVYVSLENAEAVEQDNGQGNEPDQVKSNPEKSVMYLTINQNTGVVNKTNNTPVRKSNDTNINKQRILNSTVSNIKFDNQIDLTGNRIVLSAEHMVDNSNQNATVYQICDDSSLISVNGVPKMFKSSKRYYEEVVRFDGGDEIGSAQSAEDINYVAESTQEAVIYEVLEVPGDTSEDASKLMVEESILFS